tara:strand:+ start:554 stop:1369 length:816 start_codon:yes stop_codon:yes gene_type:complete
MNISTPISTLWNSKDNVELIKKYSDSFEDRPFNNFNQYKEVFNKVLTFHCDTIQPIHKLKSKDFDFIKQIVDTYPNLKVISFHCAYNSIKCFKNKGIGYIDGYCYNENELKYNMSINIPKIKNILGDIEILIENNNYYPTKAYDIITDADFISNLVYDNNIGFLFDQAHAEITAHNQKIKYEEYVNNLPLDKCKQIHLCKMGYSKELYSENFYLAEDHHLSLSLDECAKLKSILNKCTRLEYITIEYYKDIEDLIKSIQLIKQEINDQFTQ